MPNDRAILCGSVSDGSLPFEDIKPLRLRRWGPHRNVHITIEDVHKPMIMDVPSIFLDLIDIAVYVYCADQATSRGGVGVQDFGEKWRRRFFFRIPVRHPDVWKSSAVLDQLVSTLSFLSEDEYHFDFKTLAKEPPLQGYLKFDSTPYSGIVEEVMMFSGGLDSLGGAVQEAIFDKRKVVLVNHRSTQKLKPRHLQLLSLLNKHAGDNAPINIPVRINKKKALSREYTQRTRSFLYASLGATIATMLGLNRLRFYENGIVSLNLPPSPQVVGSRATRTTHPQVLNGFSTLFTYLAGKTFTVENPFLWKTKTEVLRLIADAGCGKLIKYTTSCAHTWETTNQHPHCGMCSQCIDRRFAVLAAGQEVNDPGEAYKIDLLVGDRQICEKKKGDPLTMLAAYLEMANEIEKMDALRFFSRFGEASRVLRHIPGNPEANAIQVFEMHQRHAKQVTGVIDQALAKHGPAIRKRELPASCTLRLVYDSGPSDNLSTVSDAVGSKPSQSSCLQNNYITRKGECWSIRFDGQDEKIYTPDIGFNYLKILFGHPGTQYSASKLDCDVRRQSKELRMRTASLEDFDGEEAPITDGMGADELLDDEGRENLSTRLAEVEGLLVMKKESDSPTRLDDIDELENEKKWITSELNKARGLKGRKRQLGDERNRVRNRVCIAIRRALKNINQYDPRLGEHLVKPVLNLGHTISYVPRHDMSWSTSKGSTF
jgi:hypothetical protein